MVLPGLWPLAFRGLKAIPYICKGAAAFLKNVFICLFMAVLVLHCCAGFSLAAVSRACSLAEAHGLLIAVASVVEHGL